MLRTILPIKILFPLLDKSRISCFRRASVQLICTPILYSPVQLIQLKNTIKERDVHCDLLDDLRILWREITNYYAVISTCV
jgi:hypothetical protein